MDVTAETENTLISEKSTSSVKNLSEEFAPNQVACHLRKSIYSDAIWLYLIEWFCENKVTYDAQVLPEIPETDHRASSLAEADIDVSSQGTTLAASLQHTPCTL